MGTTSSDDEGGMLPHQSTTLVIEPPSFYGPDSIDHEPEHMRHLSLFTHPQVKDIFFSMLDAKEQLQLREVSKTTGQNVLHFIHDSVLEYIGSFTPAGSDIRRRALKEHLKILRSRWATHTATAVARGLSRALYLNEDRDPIVRCALEPSPLVPALTVVAVELLQEKDSVRRIEPNQGVAAKFASTPKKQGQGGSAQNSPSKDESPTNPDSTPIAPPLMGLAFAPVGLSSQPRAFKNLRHLVLAGCTSLKRIRRGTLYNLDTLEKFVMCRMDSLEVIESRFLSHCAELRHVEFHHCPKLEAFLHHCMNKCPNLESVTGTGDFPSLTSIGEGFLARAVNLTQLDVSGWRNVKKVGERFASWTGLTGLDVTSWSAIEHIGSDFLRGTTITSLDCSSWSNILSIASGFLFEAATLQTCNVKNWGLMKSIDADFLRGTAVESLDASSWVSLEAIGSKFLADSGVRQLITGSAAQCAWANLKTIDKDFMMGTAIQELDATGWTSLELIDSGFLRESHAEVVKAGTWSKVTGVGENFCATKVIEEDSDGKPVAKRRSTLRHLEVRGWTSAKHVGQYFAANAAFETLDVSGWVSLTLIGPFFLCDSNIKTLDLSGWVCVDHIASYFLSGSDIEALDAHGLCSLTSIKHCFLHCKALKSLNVDGWAKLQSVGEAFAEGTAISSLDCSTWQEVTSVGPNFLAKIPSLRHVNASTWRKLTFVGEGFIGKAPALIVKHGETADLEKAPAGVVVVEASDALIAEARLTAPPS